MVKMKVFVRLLFGVAVTIQSTHAAPECPSEDWIKSTKHCYYLQKNESTWREAQRFCYIFGSNLASLHSEEEIAFLNTKLFGKFQTLWIGFYTPFQDDNWKWFDGTDAKFTSWVAGQPKVYTEDCAATYVTTGKWHDFHCDTKLYSICKMAVLQSTVQNGTSECPNKSWFKSTQYCYFIYKRQLKWTEAQEYCSAVGANLASLHSEEEIAFIRPQMNGNAYYHWIGLHRASNGKWQWIDETEIKFTRWDSGQPQLSIVSCAATHTTLDKWSSEPCFTQKNGLCKKVLAVMSRNAATTAYSQQCLATKDFSSLFIFSLFLAFFCYDL
ncbi:C-type mannose receptor 2-like [Physella acuta]|uniref:C-type mannose receptor 2-like n=1 Tax=Physella acuta TaxID=109671 RepID=UPI0027DDBD39|nr:C-type mannose receptor 2-like [Physella acuta]